MTLLQSRLRLVTSSERELTSVQQSIVDLARETRQRLDAVGELYARVARSSQQLGASQNDILKVVRAVSQAIQISGNSATEAEAGMIQLAQALASGTLRGDELRSVLEQMPRVAQAIAQGLGVTVGQLRALGAEGKLTSQQVFEALISQSEKLNDEFRKLTPTIGQSFTVLKNELTRATGEFFTSTGSAARLSNAILKVAEAIRNLSDARRDMESFWDSFRDRLARLSQRFPRITAFLDSLTHFSPFRIAARFADSLDPAVEQTSGGGPRRYSPLQRGRARGPSLSVASQLEEFRTTVRSIDLSPYRRLLDDMERMTQTSAERQIAHFREVQAALEFLHREGEITADEFNQRVEEARGELVQEIDIEAIRNLYKPVREQTTELGEFMKGVWQGVGQSIQSTLSDAIYEWRLSWRSIIDITRRALADILSAILTSGIKQGLMSLFKGNGGFFSGFVKGISGLFGLAGGGIFDGPRIVGENGPEVVTGRGRVFNMRQLAFAGAGASISYAPTFNLSIQSTGDEETRQRMVEYVETRIQQSQSEFVRVLNRSGVEVKG